ncbi:MAG: DUF4398 domain-containing protein [Acidobacteria bacterium]|nr:DUF4398 domain-containing protein [Acidobacteriota bacterium]
MKTTSRSLFILSLVLGLGLALSGCASAPTEEINATRGAITAAQSDDVRTYAPESLKAAEDELNKALAEVQTQDDRFALSRDYQPASALLKSAKDLAEKANSDAQMNKAKAKTDAETTIALLPQLIEDAKKLLAKAPKGKDTRADLEAMQNDLKLAEEASAEASMALSQEKYLEALAKANTAKEKTTAVTDQVNAAIEKMRGRR